MLSEEINNLFPLRKFIARVVFTYLLIMLIYFYFNNSLVYQWRQPVLIYPEADNVYWLLHMLNIPQTIMRSEWISFAFDLIMVGSTLLFIIFPEKTLFAFVAVICLWMFQLMFGSANGHHYAHVGFLIAPLPFIFLDPKKFFFSWHIVRYWILFLFICAGLYKFYYGGFFQQENMSIILKSTYAATNSGRSKIILYLIEHPKLSQLFYQASALLELSCIIGFLTRKKDIWIFLILLAFNLGNYLMMNIPFWENGIALLLFLPWSKLYYQFFTFFDKRKIA